MSGVSVVIPVGPFPSNREWLPECLESVFNQTTSADEVLIIDDQANLEIDSPVEIWKTPWLSGVPAAFNFGVALAKNELVVMLGSDDTLQPRAIERLLATYEKQNKQDAYYYFTIKYSDTGEIQDLPCNCAAVTKGLWNLTGGFPTEAAVGACDSIFISMMMVHHSKRLIAVDKGTPLYNYRRHNESDSVTRSMAYQGPISIVRDVFSTNWKRPTWTK